MAANIIEMNMPVTSSAETPGVPVSALTAMSTSSMSRSLLSVGRVGDPAVCDVRNQCHQTIGGLRRAATEALDRQIRVDVG